MMKMTFICEHYHGQKVTFETQSELLSDVLCDLENFLRGCGYHFTGNLDFVSDDFVTDEADGAFNEPDPYDNFLPDAGC